MKIEKIIDAIYSRRPVRVLLHILFWTCLVLVQIYLSAISFNNFRGWPQNMVYANVFVSTICTIVFYYPFVYFILPRYFYKRRVWAGIRETLVLLMVFALTDVLREELLVKNCLACMDSLSNANTGYAPFLSKPISERLLAKVLSLGALIGLIFTIALPLSIKYGILFLREQYLSLKLGKENLQLEFNFLRSQVNPHFLFNTMNNIYALILNDEKKKSLETVAGLTQFLRYSLYESNSDKVEIQKEIQLIKNYLDLESIRLNHITVDFHQESDGSVNNVAPLLFIPVIENAFKHTEDVPGAFIKIAIRIENNHIIFIAENSACSSERHHKQGGIGLSNLERRLSLYYPNSCSYQATNDGQKYAVLINLQTND